MADTKISALTAASVAAAANEFAINEAGISKKLTGALIKKFCGPTLITGNSGAVATEAAPSISLQVLTSDNDDIPTTSVVTQLTATGVNVGWWLVEYFIHWTSHVAANGIAFIVDHTGTATPFMAARTDPNSSGTALATIGINQMVADEGVVGNLPSVWTVNADADVMGPNAGVVTKDSVQYTEIRALLLVTAPGNLLLRANSEIANNISHVNAGTCARYTRLS